MNSSLTITSTPFSGNGIIATCSLPTQTCLLITSLPAFSVIYSEYKSEVCHFCWAYFQGRTLRCKDGETGFYFCKEECAVAWKVREGELGREVWRLVGGCASRSGKQGCISSLKNEGGEGVNDELIEALVESAWNDADMKAEVIKSIRLLPDSQTATKKERNYLNNVLSIRVNIDIVSFLAAGILYLYTVVEKGQHSENELLGLCRENIPYIDNIDMHQHINAFLYLLAILPTRVLSIVTKENIQLIAGVAYHNTFGIHSIDRNINELENQTQEEPGSEVLGKALVPIASFFNHSCAPNVKKVRSGCSWTFRTNRTIDKGEELCITYLGGDERDMLVHERREMLKVGWGFECACERCLAELAADTGTNND